MITPDFDAYLQAFRETPLNEHTEHTGRTALEALLKAVVADHVGGKTIVQQEPKRVADKGAPDFKISRQGMILGYVETKPVGSNLGHVLKSDQLKRYRELSDNILLTDYLHFIWINQDGVQRDSLCHATDLESVKFRVREDRASAVAGLLQGFFSSAPAGIGRSQQLALALAARSKLLRDYLGEELVRQNKEDQKGRLYGLYQIFRDQVFHELTLKEFADAFAQMLAYGLFLARINSHSEVVTLRNARQFVPGAFRLIRELVDLLPDLERQEYRDILWVIEEVLSIVNGLDMAAIREDLSFRGRRAISRRVRAANEEEHRLFERDPFVYFYEDYLKAYDKATRKGRGVYYTPPPVVNFIVRAIDDILKESFGITDGLADHRRVTVLDFACGTGTFLLEVCERIFEQIGGADAGHADLIVREHLLKNIFGFEYLIAPYTIAHLKLSQYLKDKGHGLQDEERLKIFLTNTLEPIEPQPNLLLPAVSAEVEAAQRIKEQPILVITGNPPYAGHSKNRGNWIKNAIGGYKFTIETDSSGKSQEVPLGERNPKWLNDDYVKFIRFAQLRMDSVDEGIVGVITNHSWLDNPTFRGMRQSLMRSFEQIHIIDLHGSSTKREQAPDGSKDENVFDIKQGVAISLFVKRPGLERGVWRRDLWGKRLAKYKLLASTKLKAMDFENIKPSSPDYFCYNLNYAKLAEYERGIPVPDIMPVSSVGIVTGRDKLTIAYSEEEIRDRTADFVRRDVESAREHFGLREDVEDWKVRWAQEDIKKGGNVIRILYRPFDNRYTFYSGRSRGFHVRPRDDISRQLLRPNLALITSRLTKGEVFRHVQITDKPAEVICMSSKTSNNGFVFPLRIENDQENLSEGFRDFIDSRYDHHHSPEEILGYVYAILHAPEYRRRYVEFLRAGFPRIPFPENAGKFESLSSLGWALVRAHLLRDVSHRGLASYHGQGNHTIEAVRYSTEEEAVHINKAQNFKPVPQTVWEFEIGGYQVLDKYLKSRKGRTLTLAEIGHVAKVADSLAFTMEQMAAIDIAYRSAFQSEDKCN